VALVESDAFRCILPRMRIAQALLEKSMIDTISTAFLNSAAWVLQSIDERPWVWTGVLAFGLFLLFRRGRQF
jgi:hypothetical protein